MFLDALIGPVLSIIDKVVPDPAAAAAQKEKILELQQAGEFKEIDEQVQLATAQTDINKTEAASTSLLTSGWRPGVGWVGALALFFAYVPKEIVLTTVWCIGAYHAVSNAGVMPTFPDLGVTDLLGLLGSLLGFGVLRSVDKSNGVASK